MAHQPHSSFGDAEPHNLQGEFAPVGVRREREEQIDQHDAIGSVAVSIYSWMEEKGGETILVMPSAPPDRFKTISNSPSSSFVCRKTTLKPIRVGPSPSRARCLSIRTDCRPNLQYELDQ